MASQNRKYAPGERVTRKGVIMQILKDNPEGMSCKKIIVLLRQKYAVSEDSVSNLISELLQTGDVINVGRQECNCCGMSSTRYMISRSAGLPSDEKRGITA
jgi:predicted Zn-ribbon and HTH transcriptional regulator